MSMAAFPPGDRVYLNGGSGLPAGYYTLLPARYALLSGAFLVTPQSGVPVSKTVSLTDGSSIVSGYKFNGLDSVQTGQPLFASFAVAPQSVVQSRAEYDNFSANTFFVNSAQTNNISVPRLPVDSGQVVLNATVGMSIQGTLEAQAPTGGLGGLVDIDSPVDILIAGANTVVPNGFNGMVLDSSELSSFGAESLLIGGVRQTGANGTAVQVTTNKITVDNSGSPLTGSDVILAANQSLTLDSGAVIEQGGAPAIQSETLLFGNSGTPGSGDGVLLRVSSDPSAQIARSSYDTSSVPTLTIGAGATVSGASVILDSTHATHLDSTAVLTAQSIALDSGQISLQLNNPGSLQPGAGLVLAGPALQSLQTAQALSLLSYSSIDTYGTGVIGSSQFANLALHAAEIRSFNNGGGTVEFDAKNILLDNSPAATTPGPVAAPAGTLAFNAQTIKLGANQINLDQASSVALNASGGILFQGAGGLAVQGGLSITTPVITGAKAATQTITAAGALTVQAPANATVAVSGGLGASLALVGASIAENSNIVLPSGNLTLHATGGDVQVGNLSATRLDVGGVSQSFFDLVEYTSGGQITLTSDTGNVNVALGSTLAVAAQQGGGDAGGVTINASKGDFVINGALLGQGGAGGNDGTFSLDVGSLPTITQLEAALATGGFTQSQSIRVRTGDVLIGGNDMVKAQTFNLSADSGSITVAGTIDASGQTGGTIDLEAHGSLILQSGAKLSVVGNYYDDAGKGGAITLAAGSETNGSYLTATQNGDGTFSGSGYLDIQAGSEMDLGVNHQLTTSDLAQGKTTNNRIDLFTGTVHLRAPQTAGGTDLQVNPINGTINNASSIIVEGYKIYTPAGGSISSVEAAVLSNGNTFAGAKGTTTAGYTAMQNRLFANNIGLESVAVIEPGAEIINSSGDLALGTTTSTASSDWNLATYRFGPDSAAGVLTLRAAGNLVFYNALSDGFSGGSNLWLSPLMV